MNVLMLACLLVWPLSIIGLLYLFGRPAEQDTSVTNRCTESHEGEVVYRCCRQVGRSRCGGIRGSIPERHRCRSP